MQDQGIVLGDRFKADADANPAAVFLGVNVANNEGDVQNMCLTLIGHRKFDPGVLAHCAYRGGGRQHGAGLAQVQQGDIHRAVVRQRDSGRQRSLHA